MINNNFGFVNKILGSGAKSLRGIENYSIKAARTSRNCKLKIDCKILTLESITVAMFEELRPMIL